MELLEAHFCSLQQSQSNVYGLCKIDLPNKPNEILIATLIGKVVSLKYAKNKPLSREVRFTYIPGDAEIISIDAFNKFQHGNNVVIGISFVKELDGKACYYLNVYSDWEQSADFNLDSVAQGWHNIELNFTPYQLSHTEFVHGGNVEMVFLLSGSDGKIHMFMEEKQVTEMNEVAECEAFFPEFSDLPSNVTWLQCEYFQDYQRRVTAVGCFNGTVKVTLVNTETSVIISSWTVEHDSPITSLTLFTVNSDVECPHFVTEVVDSLEDPMEFNSPEYNLLVNSAVEGSIVYRDILKHGLSYGMMLHDSDMYDCVLCGCVADVDLDGQNEIIVGTYGQELLVYKFFAEENSKTNVDIETQGDHAGSTNNKTLSTKCPALRKSSETLSLNLTESSDEVVDIARVEQSPLAFRSGHFDSETTPLACIEVHKGDSVSKQTDSVRNSDNGSMSPNVEVGQEGSVDDDNVFHTGDNSCDFDCVDEGDHKLSPGSFRLLWKQSFSEPVFAIDSLDTTGDGLEELVVLTQKGIHILQHDIEKAADLCLNRLRQARLDQGLPVCEDAFKQLLSENLAGSYPDDLVQQDL